MARLPRNATEAVADIGITAGQSVIVVGPDHGFVEALASAVGDDGTLVVSSPPPDEDLPKGIDVVTDVAEDAKADHVIGWVGIVPVHNARKLTGHVADGGALWLVLPKAERDARATVTEGEVKRAMLSAGWREERVVGLSTDSYAVRFRRRR